MTIRIIARKVVVIVVVVAVVVPGTPVFCCLIRPNALCIWDVYPDQCQKLSQQKQQQQEIHDTMKRHTHPSNFKNYGIVPYNRTTSCYMDDQ